MKRSLIAATVCLSAALLQGACASTGIALLDGRSLTGWTEVGDAEWKIEDRLLIGNAGGGDGMLVTTQSYGDFRLTAEFWVDEVVNSGIFLRCSDSREISPYTCYEINIWDDHPMQDMRTGAIVMKAAPPLAKVNTAGEWNRCEITAINDRISVVLNGVTTAELVDGDHSAGFIALQSANKGEARFRNIVLEQL